MSAESFVKLARSQGLLNTKRFEKIMRQIESADKPISEGRIAKVLVSKEIITNDEARRILALLAESATSRPPPPPAELEQLEPELEVRDDEPVAAAKSATSPPPPAELEPLEPDLEVLDDEPVAAAKAPPVAELEEVDAIFTGSSTTTPAAADTSLETEGIGQLEAGVATGGKIKSSKKGLLAQLGLGGRRRAPRVRGNRWDSPLMLVGGGTLLLLLIGGVALGWFLTRETGEEVFATAEEDYRAQKYTNAISKYERFLEKFPSHPKASVARVRTAMSRIRQVVESGSDWERALTITTRELPPIKSEEAFKTEARPDLSRLLPDIYAGFIDSAGNAEDPAQKQILLDKSQEALQLIDNPEYLPGSLRKTVQLDIERTNEKAALIIREINRDKELITAIAAIEQATAEQNTTQAYTTRGDLLSRYPGLATHPDLVAAVQQITSAERAKVTISEQGLTAETVDHSLAIKTRVTLAARDTKKATGVSDRNLFALANGALYGLSANDGSVLWRRWLGYANPIQPQPIDADADADALAFDEARQELLRLAGNDGQLVWRLPLGESIATPIIDSNRVGVATQSGKFAWVDAETGNAAPVAQLPQNLTVGPGIDSQKGRLYQVGQHSSLYVLSADTLACDNVVYVGHRRNSVKVPAVPVAGHVFVAENGGDFAWLHVLAGDANGIQFSPAVQKIRLDGEVHAPMLRFGRRLLVVTDLGAMHVYDVDPANAAKPVREIAKTLPANREKGISYPLVEGGQIFLADTKIARFQLQSSRGELVRQWVEDGEEIYIAPPTVYNNVIFSVRRHGQSSATQVVAMRTATGRNELGEGELLWSTDLGAAPAMAPQYDTQRRAITVVSSEAGIWDIGGSHINAGKLDQLAARATGEKHPLVAAAVLTDGQVVLAHSGGGRRIVILNPAATERLQNISISISPQHSLTEPVGFGQQMLVCSSSGAIHALDPQGTESVLPFQPGLSVGTTFRWLPPAVIDASQRTFVAASGDGTVYRIGPQAQPKPHFAATTTANLNVTLARNLAVIDNQVLVIVRAAGADEIRMLSLPDLTEAGTTPIEGRVTWGPHWISQQLSLVATDANQMVAIGPGGKILWSSPLPYGDLAGDPLVNDRFLLLTSVNGQVWQIAIRSGELLPWSAKQTHLDVGEPLGTGAAVFSNRLLLLGRDSTLFITELPTPAATANADR